MALDPTSPAQESGFLSRWSQRKQALRQGQELPEPLSRAKPVDDELLKQKQPVASTNTAQSAPDLIAGDAPPEDVAKPLPAPTMQDAQALTPQSDFKPFMRADVSPQVKNAAMKQLFKDPHFNVMDMMDVYVDDYSKPDPLPPEMLRNMAVTHFLGFWKEEEEEEAARLAAEKKAREDAGEAASQTVAQSEHENSSPTATDLPEESLATARETDLQLDQSLIVSQPEHDHPDLQLQPDDAAGQRGAVKSAG